MIRCFIWADVSLPRDLREIFQKSDYPVVRPGAREQNGPGARPRVGELRRGGPPSGGRRVCIPCTQRAVGGGEHAARFGGPARGEERTANTSSRVDTRWNAQRRRGPPRGCPRGRPRCPSGRMTSVMPARWAPSTFSLTPPMGRTRPRRVISPVIATSRRTGRPDMAETIAVAMAAPAEGPSLGMAPAGHVDVDLDRAEAAVGDLQRSGAWVRGVGQGGAGRLLHHVAELAGEDQRDVAVAAGLHGARRPGRGRGAGGRRPRRT